jgi:hypothetical protein
MTYPELSNQFDILYNNITSNQAPGLNGYEKSVFLTKAEYETLKNHFIPTSNKLGAGFDDSAKRQIDFSSLIRKITFSKGGSSSYVIENDNICNLSSISNEILFIVNEEVTEDGKSNVVVPISYEEYDRLKAKPYNYPLKNQVWRLYNSTDSYSGILLIGHYNSTITGYTIRYVKKPNPIVIPDEEIWPETATSTEYTIGGWPKVDDDDPNNITLMFPNIEIPEELQEEVLQRAVELAKIAWEGTPTSSVQAGQRSE